MMKYYLAYGSNLSVEQMSWRCPKATIAGTGFLEGKRLLFRRGFLTVEPDADIRVPVLVWQVTPADEKSLDHYEGYPKFYRKENLEVDLFSVSDGELIGKVNAFVYIMNDGFPLQAPTVRYWDVCVEGYQRFGFDVNILKKALDESIEKRSFS